MSRRHYVNGAHPDVASTYCRDPHGPARCEHCDGERDDLRGWICKSCDSALDEMYGDRATRLDGVDRELREGGVVIMLLTLLRVVFQFALHVSDPRWTCALTHRDPGLPATFYLYCEQILPSGVEIVLVGTYVPDAAPATEATASQP